MKNTPIKRQFDSAFVVSKGRKVEYEWGVSSLRMKSVRWLGQKIFERSGFAWDLRRAGDLKIGLWRKRLRSSERKGVATKRFVLTPGFGDAPLSWLLVCGLMGPALKRAGYDEVVILDFPGFNGRLAAEKCIPTMELLLAAAGDVFDWLEPHTVLGHSLGGWLTAHYAADCGAGLRPRARRRHGYEGPAQILLVAAAGVYESEAVREAIGEVFKETVSGKGFEALRPHLFAKEPLWFDWVAKDFSRFAEDAGIRQFTESFREEQLLQHRLHQIRARTWLLWGDRDTLVPTGGVKTWLDGLGSEPGAPEAVLIRGVGHSPQIEKPVVTAAAISRILIGAGHTV